jgi:hypothetical protein
VNATDIALRWIFLEHPGYRFAHQLHIFRRVLLVQGALSDAVPDQLFCSPAANIHDEDAGQTLPIGSFENCQ